ncbi:MULTISPECIES: pyrroline-5-carboxylate reductase [Cryobacterium]|uniref:Pyrroline-5-carboxylate reductase n=1 Tax=Cryobacterium glucosi TaxID=1259175 RepID=A0ABY2IIX6_9MICO|nr:MULTISPECIES: pyrroline-5-carboxylate reductase [Cryobacterium]MDY7529408.1 pyrroline-5-carboxylate reductase [Cryobacterium sp. 10C2]MDY7558442.1 pyrroline-5-carboxylate reductase [Cryobacterium sp. 10C3]MEB0201682.1 pyrroline-5-carboxylate reductase [Cryobacterium sp. 5I3]MEB0289459.1 pyrroline-5-carboxylate reductase [Cryobacterium sp. 10C2]TFC17746.1 pyrroline-5-carboxylate reductase [Cryobacterium glucosi]
MTETAATAVPPTVLPTIAFLGAGSMARAVLTGLLTPAVTVEGGIRATNRTAEKAAELHDLPGVTAWATALDPDANRTAVTGARIVVVAVKPAMVPDLLREIASSLAPGTLVVSVAAGVTIATFEALLPASVAVIRSMPNTPALVGKAVTGLSAGSRSTAADLDLARALFGTVGSVLVVPEDKLDALSTISGSGPAYVFYLIEEFTRTAIDKGFTAEEAAILVNGTFLGASTLLAASPLSPGELRRQVTSPHGTTERAVWELEKGGLKELFDRATDAALARARELAAPTD